jgi:hypothetical protein
MPGPGQQADEQIGEQVDLLAQRHTPLTVSTISQPSCQSPKGARQ